MHLITRNQAAEAALTLLSFFSLLKNKSQLPRIKTTNLIFILISLIIIILFIDFGGIGERHFYCRNNELKSREKQKREQNEAEEEQVFVSN